ncbi:MAG: hypothetical protein QXN01_00450 [Candidatus Anstonellales archaeon]
MERKILFWLMLLLFLSSLLVVWANIQHLDLNFFQIKQPQEIFVSWRGGDSFNLSANFDGECSICGIRREIQSGDNRLSYGGCESRIIVECADEQGRNSSLAFLRPKIAEVINLNTWSKREDDGGAGVIFVSGATKNRGDLQVSYFIDGILKRRFFEKNVSGEFVFGEKFRFDRGEHTYQIDVNGVVVEGVFDYEGLTVPVSQVIIVTCSVILALAVGRGHLERIFSMFCFLAIFFAFHYEVVSLFKAEFFVPAIADFLAILFVSRKLRWRFWLPKIDEKEVLWFVLVGLGLVVLSNIFIGSLDLWGPYYYRHVQAVMDKGGVFYSDLLSYLGRPFTYPPAYFQFAAGLTSAFFISDFETVRLFEHLLIASLYFASLYMLFFKYLKRARVLGALITISEVFVLVTASNVTLHIFAYTLMHIAAILSTGRGRIFLFILLGISVAAHPSSIVLFPFYALVANQFELKKRFVLKLIACIFGGLLVCLPFYSIIFYKYGLPYEIAPYEWGYLLTWGFGGMVNDFGPLLFLGLSGAFLVLLARLGFIERRFDGVGLPKLIVPAILIFVFFILGIFVSFRANMLFGVMSAALVSSIFERSLSDKKLFYLLCLFCVFNFILFFLVQSGPHAWCYWGVANDNCLLPMKYLEKYTKGESSVVANPRFGHLETYIGKRKILSDLYVEYADNEKYLAAVEAYKTGVLPEEFEVDYLVLDVVEGAEQGVSLDKIYDNGFASIWEK